MMMMMMMLDWHHTNDVMMSTATECEGETWLDAARDVVSIADVTETRGVVGEPYPHLYDAWTSEELATWVRRNGRQRCMPDRHISLNLTVY